MFNSLNDQLRTRAKALREADSAASDAAESLAHDVGDVPDLIAPQVSPPSAQDASYSPVEETS